MAAAKKTSKLLGGIAVWRYATAVALLCLSAMAAVFAWQQLEGFLIRDPAFILAAPAEYGDESPNLRLEGLHYASRARILSLFQEDIGRSIYLFPLAERRKELLRAPWVKDATIIRIWPNRITVRIAERQPVAFLAVRSSGIARWSVIDADGVIMDPPERTTFDFPVITGIDLREKAAQRGMRVRRMTRLLDQLTPEMRHEISEVDVSDADDPRVTMKVEDRAVVLMLGDRNFRARIQNFLDHAGEIRRRAADMAVLDLRLDDRITVVGGRHGG